MITQTRRRTLYELTYVNDGDPEFSADEDREFTLDRATWIAMGRPGEITVTIEPGDLLNEAG